jgi:predicted dehydrogenase
MIPSSIFSNKTLRFGLVGAGAIAGAYVDAFEGLGEASIVAIADCRLEAAAALARRVNCASYADVESMMHDCRIDAAIVCTPPATHAEISIQLMERGTHVLCEKPFSIDSDSAEEMLHVAQSAGVKLTMGAKFRFVEDVVHAKSIVDSGVLGELLLVENVFATRVDMATRWNSRPEISGGGVIIDNGTHSVDLVRYFLGPLIDLRAVEGKRRKDLAVEETATLFLRSENGANGTIDLSWNMSKPRESFLDIYGSRGSVSVGWKKSWYVNFADGTPVSFGEGYQKVAAFRSQIRNFARAIRNEEPLTVTVEDALASVYAIEAAYRALRQHQWTPLSATSAEIDARIPAD